MTSIITQAQAEAQLSLWLAASEALASGKSYTIGTRALTRSDSSEVIRMIEFWERRVVNSSRGGIRIIGGTPT